VLPFSKLISSRVQSLGVADDELQLRPHSLCCCSINNNADQRTTAAHRYFFAFPILALTQSSTPAASTMARDILLDANWFCIMHFNDAHATRPPFQLLDQTGD
jgi:hypothetical protein